MKRILLDNEIYKKHGLNHDTITTEHKSPHQTITTFPYINMPRLWTSSSIKSIDGHKFSGWPVTEVRFDEDNESLVSIGNHAFSGCTNLRMVRLNEGLKSIGDHAFFGCTRLTYVRLNKGLESIGNNAFSGCTRLERFYLGPPPNIDHLSQVGKIEFLEKAGRISYLERTNVEGTNEEMFVVTADLMSGGANWNLVKQSIDRIVALVHYCEIRDVATPFELALWKAEMGDSAGMAPEDRNKYRIEAPGPIRDTIMQYLGFQ